MRFPSIAVCTLSILLTGGLTAQASESPSSESFVQKPAIDEANVATPTVAQSKIEAIASSERLEEQPFLQKAAVDSKQEYLSDASSLGQNSQVKELAEIPKTAEALHADNSGTEPTPNTNQPVLDKSPLAGISKAEALRPNEIVSQSLTNNPSQVLAEAAPAPAATCVAQAVPVGSAATNQLAQGTPGRCPRPTPIAPLELPKPVEESGASPALSIYIPVGYGADRNTVFLTGSYQASVREDEGSVGAGGIGIGLGDARKALGVELSYALETTDNSFGEGGFNAKVHRQLGQDLAGAIGWNGFLNIGRNDFEQSKYGVLTKVFRTQESLNSAFSRVAFTVGVGDGQFRSNGAVKARDNNVNVFGNVAVRVVRPVSFIAEWTGQDLALGLSIAPFKNVPFVITPAVRDIAGAGDGARFVLGAGTAFRF